MRDSLKAWISESDAFTQMEHLGVRQASIDVASVRTRADDYYLGLIGELFDRLSDDDREFDDWDRLGNALAQFALPEWNTVTMEAGVSKEQASLFSAAAFYAGGYPASSYVVLKEFPARAGRTDSEDACFDLITRPSEVKSKSIRRLLALLRRGDLDSIGQIVSSAAEDVDAASRQGPDEWIGAFLLHGMLQRFSRTNVRAVLPDGESQVWNPLVKSLLNRHPATWEFFPSQIEAIRAGLLNRANAFSLQMPTGAGKTTLAETLIYSHAMSHPQDVSVLVVPYRALASELRKTLVRRLNAMGIPARCAYGGTVPCGNEARDLETVRVMVATPESLSGILGAHPDFFARISLVICDEGHLLDSGSRGVGLELLLARMKARQSGPPRFVFISAIVPNMEEINAWLGGTDESVVRSDYRPAWAEFALLGTDSSSSNAPVSLVMHPHEPDSTYALKDFLSRADFAWINQDSGRANTYAFNTVLSRAVATARKALPMGAAVVYSANRTGKSGVLAIGEELLRQLGKGLPMPEPASYADSEKVSQAVEYLDGEYGSDWVCTRLLAAGAVLHHGQLPQETRDVLEDLVLEGSVRLALCTSTLAEGVNFPIRTLVLYSVRRRTPSRLVDPLTRDIKNLVGRAGRPGSTTRGLVVCANPNEWPLVEQVAQQAASDPVNGALSKLVNELQRVLRTRGLKLNNELLDRVTGTRLLSLIDGVDAMLVDLADDEIGREALVQMAEQVAQSTYAAHLLDEDDSKLLNAVFSLRAEKVATLVERGQLGWVRDTGARIRMVDSVVSGLLDSVEDWSIFDSPTDPALMDAFYGWASSAGEFEDAIRTVFRLDAGAKMDQQKKSVRTQLIAWIEGKTYGEMATALGSDVDSMLAVQAQVIGYALQTIIEQAVALLEVLLREREQVLPAIVSRLPEHIRFGVPTREAVLLGSAGVRHRRACVLLGDAIAEADPTLDPSSIVEVAREAVTEAHDYWSETLGPLVWSRTRADLLSSKAEVL